MKRKLICILLAVVLVLTVAAAVGCTGGKEGTISPAPAHAVPPDTIVGGEETPTPTPELPQGEEPAIQQEAPPAEDTQTQAPIEDQQPQ